MTANAQVHRQHGADRRALPIAVAEAGIAADHQEAGAALHLFGHLIEYVRLNRLHLCGGHIADNNDIIFLFIKIEESTRALDRRERCRATRAA